MADGADSVGIAFPSGYSSYSKKRLQEDDLVIRKHLQNKIGTLRRELIATLDQAQTGGLGEAREATRKAVDEVDLFVTDLQTSELGAKFPWGSAQRSATPSRLAAVAQFDSTLVDRVDRATETLRVLRDAVRDKRQDQLVWGIQKIQEYLREARGAHRDRLLKLKGLVA